MPKQTVIIAGGGLSGLVAANELSSEFNVVLIEALDQLGGRVRSFNGNGFSCPVQAGAEFIHGNATHILKLLKEAGLSYKETKGKMYRKERGKWIEERESIDGWEGLISKMKKLRSDMTLLEFLEENYGEDQYADLRRHTIAFAEGFDIADVSKVSVKSLYAEWANQGQNFRPDGGFDPLVKFLEKKCREKGCKILTGQPVIQVDWEKGMVTVYTRSGEKYYGEKFLYTLPLSILQTSSGIASINFTPALDNHMLAASMIGFGNAIKVIMEFNEVFWKNDTGFVLSDEIIPTWWTQLPNTIPLLTGWAGGTKAARLAGETDQDLLEKAFLSVSSIFDVPVQNLKQGLKAARVFNWAKNEWALGAYSYIMLSSGKAEELLNQPVDETLYFSGEGLYEGPMTGTVEAAIVHAKNTASRMKG